MTAKSKKPPVAETTTPGAADTPQAEGAGENPTPAAPEPAEEPAGGAEQAPEPTAEPAAAPPGGGEPAGELDRELAVYPAREGSADPRWAVNIVWGWTWFTLLCLAFVLALVLLGYFYD